MNKQSSLPAATFVAFGIAVGVWSSCVLDSAVTARSRGKASAVEAMDE